MKYSDVLINDNTTVAQAMRKLDSSAKRVLFVVQETNELIGAVSDGDIRRWLLKEGSLSDPVSKFANSSPISISSSERISAELVMDKMHIDALPVVDESNRVIDIVFRYNDKTSKGKVNSFNIPVVIMAGGKGTRLYPYTKILPKPLIPVGDIPISEYIVNRFRQYGCNDFYFIVNYKKNMIKAYYNEIEKNYSVFFIDEDEPLGTGGGISLLKGTINSTFVLTNCDTVIDDDFNEMLKAHKSKKNLVTMVCSLCNYEVPYGVVEMGENGSFKSLTEKPNMSFFTNTGTYIVEPEVIDVVEPHKRIGFPDVVQRLKNDGKNVGVYPINENSWFDMGQFDTMENMKERLHIKE